MTHSTGYVDAHCHLPKNRFSREWEKNLHVWKSSGIEAIIGVSMTMNESLKILKLAKNVDMVIPAIGIHPWKIKKEIDANNLYNEFEKIIKSEEDVKVIGEVGLDYRFVEKVERHPFQRSAFDAFTQLARDHELLLSIHCVSATEDVLHILRKNNVPARHCIFHWYSGKMEELKLVLDYGPYFSITPAATYSEMHQNTVKQAPLERLLTESDGDVKYKNGIRGSPEIIPHVIDAIATIRQKDTETVKNRIQDNFNSLLQQ